MKAHIIWVPVLSLVMTGTLFGQPAAGTLELRSDITAGATGGRLTLTHTVSNTGPTVAAHVWITNQLPTGVSFRGTAIATRPPLSLPTIPRLRTTPLAAGVTFAPPVSTGSSPAVAVAVADLDLDGLPDIVAAHGTGANGFSVWHNTSGGLVDVSPPPSPVPDPVSALTVGDFNGDGIPDIVVVGSGGKVLTAWYAAGDHPDFHYAPGATLPFPTPITRIVACDFDGDGNIDLVALEPALSVLHLLRSTADMGLPGFSEVGTLACPAKATSLLAARRDGPDPGCAEKPDLFVTSEGSTGGVVSVFRHTCIANPLQGFYQPRTDHPCGPSPRDLAMGDLDGDGFPDLAVANGPGGTITLLRASGTEGFEIAGVVRVAPQGATGDVQAVRMVDLDGDGAPELITGLAGQSACVVIPNSRTAEPLSEAQFFSRVLMAVPAPFSNIGSGPCGGDPVGRSAIVVVHSEPGGPGLPSAAFSALRLTQPGAIVSFSLGEIAAGQTISADLDLEVGRSGATNAALAASSLGTGLNNFQPLPTAVVCGRMFCVANGVTRVMPGVSVTVTLGGSFLTATATAVTGSNGRFCVPFPFACGKYPAGATITITSPACPGQVWTYPASILYAALAFPPLYCENCAPCADPATSFTINSGRGAGGLIPLDTIDPQFALSGPGVASPNPFAVAPINLGGILFWLPNSPNSEWVAPDGGIPREPIGPFAYQARFFLPCIKDAEIIGQWAADDTGTIHLNGQPTGVTLPTGLAFNSWHSFNITSGFLSGWNTLTFWVTNVVQTSPSGLRVELTGTTSGDCCGSCLEIVCPAPINLTTCSNCVPAYFDVRAVNPCCAKTAVTCFPPSGTLFPIGTNLVRCVATDICGGKQACAFPVIVKPRAGCCQPPALVVAPQDTYTPQGGNATLNVAATGTPPLGYQWRRDGTNLPSATGTNFFLPNIQPGQAGRYSVCVSNACGVVTSVVAQVLVSRPAVPDVALTVEVLPAVRVGNNYVYNFILQNVGIAPASGLVLTGYWASAQIGLVSGPPGCVFGFPPNALTMTCNVGSLPVGGRTNYLVTISALAVGGVGFGAAVSGDPSELNLANNTAGMATAFGHRPGVTVQPVAFGAVIGGAGSFSLMATGTPSLAYFWRHDGTDLGTNGPGLGFTELHSSDSGSYVCTVSNAWGMTTSAPVVITFTYPAAPTAVIVGGQTLRVTGSSTSDDLEVRLKAGDPTKLEVDNLGNPGIEFTFNVNAFTRLVIELGDQNGKLVFNDVNGPVSALANKTFEIHGGAGSNLVVASSTGINLALLPGLLATFNAAPNFEALAQGIYDQANTNLLNPSIALVGQLHSNMVQTAQRLLAMANTNIAAQASNLVAQGQALSREASNCVNLAVCKFANPSLAQSFSCEQFTNCLFALIAQLEAVEDGLTNNLSNMALTGPENLAESISDQMEALIEAHEEAAEMFELGMDAIYDTGADAFYAKVAAGLEGPGDALGEVAGPNFEALAEQFEALAEQLLEMQAVMVEAQADALTTQALNLEAAANAVAMQAAALEQALDTFTAAADPQLGPPPQFVPAAAIPTGTNAGCDRSINTVNPFFISVGGIIIGTPLKDTIQAHPNTTLIFGLGNDDLIFGNTNANIIFGGRGNDEIHGLAGNDLLFGGRGHDCIFGDEGFDLIFGGEGDDNLHGGTNIDLIIGWTGNDKIFGDENIDILIGWDGDDEMDGGDGIDVMFGGKGNDIMYGGPGFKITNDIPFICKFEIGNLMFGGDGDDKMYGSDGLDVMFGGPGADEIYGSNQVDVIFGNAGNDKIYGGDGGAIFYVIPQPGVTNGVRLGGVIFGGDGDDIIEGGKDIDVIFGGNGNDNIRGSYTYPALEYPPISFDCGIVDIGFDIDIIFGGDGDDYLDGGQDSDVIFGGKGNDTILGNGETDKIAFPEIGLLFGGTENDTIIGGPNDILTLAFGGRNDDFILGSKWGVMNLLFGGKENDTIEGNGDLITLAFGGRGDDTVNGGGFVIDLLFGGPGNDRMDGKVGVLDLMFGGDGEDVMNGGTSVLKLMFGNAGNDTMTSGLGAIGLMFGNRGCDTMTNQALVGLDFGNRESDSIYGSFPALVEIFFGNDDDDYLQGGGLLDILFGNAGNDTIRSGPILTLAFGNSGNDTLEGGGGLDLLFGNTGNDHINGNSGVDLIFGGQGDDKIDGGDGPDLIFGGPGNDMIVGGDGIDLIFGGPGNDAIWGGPKTDLLFGGRGTYADTINGEDGADILFGQKGNDYLDGGGGGKDRVWGGKGNDYLIAASGTGTRLRGNRDDDKFRVDGATSVHVHGGAGSDTYQVASGSTAKTTSSTSGTVAYSAPPFSPCAEIHGTKWRDDNGNGIRDSGEPGIVGVTLYLDLNNNGAYDGGEPWTTTMFDNPATKADETGMYWFTMLAPGTYHVREIAPAVWQQTWPPANGAHDLTLGPITIVSGRDFGNKPVCIPPPSGLVLWLPLDETTGNTAYNRVGGPNGTHYGNPSALNGLVSSSRCYDAGNQFTDVPHHGLVDIVTGDFGIDAWVKRPADPAGGVENIVDKRGNTATGFRGYAFFLLQGRLWCQLADGATYDNYDSGIPVPADGQWHFVALSVQRGNVVGGKFWVDGGSSTFNPTPHSGSLANFSSLKVAGGRPGCLDEVEVFNRALTITDIARIFGARASGKCKVNCLLRNEVTAVCSNAQSVVVNVVICNKGALADNFTFSLAGLPVGAGCNIAGPTVFNPASGTVNIGPGQCFTIPVTITRPVGMVGNVAFSQVACYQVTVNGPFGGAVAGAMGKLSRPPGGICVVGTTNTGAASRPFFPVYISREGLALSADGAKVANVPVTFRNDGPAPVNFNARFSVRVSDEPPVVKFESPVSLAAGAASEIVASIGFDMDDPASIYTVLIEADMDGDGEFEALSSFAVGEVIQGEMEIDWQLAMDPGLPPMLRPTVTWSGFGTLEAAPGLGLFPTPWSTVPGNPGSPYKPPFNATNRLELFRLRQ